MRPTEIKPGTMVVVVSHCCEATMILRSLIGEVAETHSSSNMDCAHCGKQWMGIKVARVPELAAFADQQPATAAGKRWVRCTGWVPQSWLKPLPGIDVDEEEKHDEEITA